MSPKDNQPEATQQGVESVRCAKGIASKASLFHLMNLPSLQRLATVKSGLEGRLEGLKRPWWKRFVLDFAFVVLAPAVLVGPQLYIGASIRSRW